MGFLVGVVYPAVMSRVLSVLTVVPMIMITSLSSACGGPPAQICTGDRQSYNGGCIRNDVFDVIQCVHDNQGDKVDIDRGKTLGGTLAGFGITASSTSDLRDKTVQTFTPQTPENARYLMNKCFYMAERRNEPPAATPASAPAGGSMSGPASTPTQ